MQRSMSMSKKGQELKILDYSVNYDGISFDGILSKKRFGSFFFPMEHFSKQFKEHQPESTSKDAIGKAGGEQ